MAFDKEVEIKVNMFFHFAIHVMEMFYADFEQKQCLFEDLNFMIALKLKYLKD